LAKFVSFLIDMGSNPAEAGHCVTTVGKLFTPAVPSEAEGRPKQLTPGIAAPLYRSGEKSFTYVGSVLLSLSSLIGG